MRITVAFAILLLLAVLAHAGPRRTWYGLRVWSQDEYVLARDLRLCRHYRCLWDR